jgi:MOSC domain-containing protein YiiM
MTPAKQLTMTELEAGLEGLLQSPKDAGALVMIVRRPQIDARQVLDEGRLDVSEGLVGDNWKSRGNSRTPDGSAHPDTQVTLMNACVIGLLAQEKERWPLAGDQLFVDLDLSLENLPPGAQLALGSAVVEVTAQPHTGCSKFAERFGLDALNFVNSPQGKQLRLRGLHARIVRSGVVRTGDVVRKLA